MKATHRPARPRVLVIDDNESIHEDFRKILGGPERDSGLTAAKAALFGTPEESSSGGGRMRVELDVACQGEEGFHKVEAARLEGRPYAVAFVDMRMPPGWNGLATIQRIWSCDRDIQVVICTAYSDYSLDQIISHLGDSDRLLILKKPFDAVEILQLARSLCEKWNLKREADLKLEELEHLVQERTAQIEHDLLYDRLTGLPNRTLLCEHVTAAIARRKRHPDYRFAVLFLDFDRFKMINDSMGHEAGDLLLIEVARRLRDSLRPTDQVAHTSTPARLGGDEFVVFVDDLKEEPDAARVAQRLLKVISEPYLLNQQRLHLTMSVGVATADRNYENAGEMIRDADTAMYRAKAAGRARYVMFDALMHREVGDRLVLESDLRKVVQDQGLEVHYQPIIGLADRRLVGFEALVRWTHAQRGPIPADEIISVAEDTGLILPMGLQVLRASCLQLKSWQSSHPRLGKMSVSVNLSRRQLIDPELVRQVQLAIEQAGLEPASLVLEITESTVFHNPQEALATFKQLRQLGVWLHLDDFGTGHSSIGCLEQLPLSGVKIDRAFLCDVCERKERLVVLKAIITMARAFQLQIIAEGVETEAQVGLLTRLGCDYAQGYFFGRPTSAEEADAFIQRQLSATSRGAEPVLAR